MTQKLELRRRSLLLGLLGAGVAAGCSKGQSAAARDPSRTAAKPTPKKVLILGGTSFLGPEIVQVAQARGHTLTLFNRGKTNPGMFPDLEKLHGDRKTGDLEALKGRTWDVVIDTSGYFPRQVNDSAGLLAGARQYVFISSVSVYDKPAAGGVDETAPVGRLDDPTVEKIDEKTYGPLKAACERAAEAKMPGRVTVVRPGLIVGPGDPTDRFTYWPVRIAEGGEVLAPGVPSDPLQVIDARDLGAWIVRAFEEEHFGIYNAVGPAKDANVGTTLAEVARGVGGDAKLTWVDTAFLASQKVEPWSDMPAWIPASSEEAGMARAKSARAIAKGLTFRPLAETAKDTLAWWKTLPEERRKKPRAGLSREREREVLAAFHAQKA